MMTAKTWLCDSCGESIQQASHAWVEWLTRKQGDRTIGHGLRLVHHSTAHEPMDIRCQYDQREEHARDGSVLHDLPPGRSLGADGLMHLLSFVARAELPIGEILELTKRLHIPGYEHARFHFDQAISDGVVEPQRLRGYYTQSEIQAVLDYSKSADSLVQ